MGFSFLRATQTAGTTSVSCERVVQGVAWLVRQKGITKSYYGWDEHHMQRAVLRPVESLVLCCRRMWAVGHKLNSKKGKYLTGLTGVMGEKVGGQWDTGPALPS